MISTLVLSHCFQNKVYFKRGLFVSLHGSKNEVYYASSALFLAHGFKNVVYCMRMRTAAFSTLSDASLLYFF